MINAELINLGRELREIRRKKTVTLKDLARELEVSRHYIYRLENSFSVSNAKIAREKIENYVKENANA